VVGAIALAVVLSQGDKGAASGADTAGAAAPVQPVVPTAQVPDTTTRTVDSTKLATAGGGASTTTPPSPPANVPVVKPTVPASNGQGAATNANPAGPPPAPTAPKRDAELQRVIEDFDKSEGTKIARETLDKIQAMYSRLGSLDQAWAQITMGTAHYALGDKAAACAAYQRAMTLAATSIKVREDSEEKQLMIGCRP
jgi:hypothetical protein